MALQLEVAVLARKNVDLLPRDALHAAMKRATLRATNTVLRRAFVNASGRFFKVRSGRLRQGLTQEVRTLPDGYEGIVGTNPFYAKYLEFGTGPHDIVPRFKKALRFKIGNRVIFAKRVHHPGMAPRPFLRTALDESRPDIDRFFDEEIAKAIAQQATA